MQCLCGRQVRRRTPRGPDLQALAWGAVPEGHVMPSLRFYTIVRGLTAMAAAAAALAASAGNPGAVETLRSVAAVPPHIVGALAEPAAFAAIPNGELVVFDRRGHTLVAVDREMRAARPIVQIGGEPGRILQPFGFDVDSQGLLIVGDAPDRQERIQVFTATGSRLAGFWLPHRDEPRIQFEGIALNGVSSLHATPRQTVLLSMPHTGALFAEYRLRRRRGQDHRAASRDAA